MKYLKTFENYTDQVNVYWKIDCKSLPYVKASLMKIGANYSMIEYAIKEYTDGFFYICKGFEEGDSDIWWYSSRSFKEFKNDKKMKFLGIVKVTNEEIDAYKYNL